MPTYQGQLTEEEILELISYIKSLGEGTDTATRETPSTISDEG